MEASTLAMAAALFNVIVVVVVVVGSPLLVVVVPLSVFWEFVVVLARFFWGDFSSLLSFPAVVVVGVVSTISCCCKIGVVGLTLFVLSNFI
jgi:hypothetical protein